MIQANVLVQNRPFTTTWLLSRDGGDAGEGLLKVLERAAEDNGFIAQLTCQGEKALQDYNLTWQEKAALLSGDIGWIERHLGAKLDVRQRTWLDCRLQQEIW